MHADMAPNSDSTMRYSHDVSSPVRTRSARDSTMCVCGEMGYAAITSGRHSVTARATACEPSIWLSIGQPPQGRADVLVGGPGGPGVAGPHLAGKPVPDRVAHRAERYLTGERGEGTEQCRVRQRATEVLPRDLGGGHGDRVLAREPLDQFLEPELVEGARGVEHQEAVGLQPGEQVDLVEERRVLDDQCVRVGDRLTEPDRAVVNAAEGHHRRTSALGPEGRERLGVAALVERRHGQQLRRRDGTLTPAAVDAYSEHRGPPFPMRLGGRPGLPQGRWTRVVGPSPPVRTALDRCG